MPRDERRIVEICRMAQDLVPGYAEVWLEEADLFLLGARLFLDVTEEEGLAPTAIPLHGSNERELILRAGLPEVVRRFFVLRHVGFRLAPSGTPPVVAEVFALLGVLPRADVAGPEGERVQRERVGEIAAVPGLWPEPATARYLLQLTEELRPQVVWTEPEPPDPEEAWRLYEQGLSARRASAYERAEKRFRRAAKMARGCRDWELLARAQLAIAKTSKQRGNYPSARRLLRKALRTAQHYGVGVVEGMTLQELFALAVDTGVQQEALHWAREAFETYRYIRHPNLLRLAHDIGRHWINLGDYPSGLAVLKEVLPHLQRSEEVMLVWGNIARAAAGVNDRKLFEEAHARMGWLAASSASEEHFARSTLEAAIGAAHLGMWERAETGALRALEVALRRSEAVSRFMAEALLRNVQMRRTGEAPQVPPSRRRSELTEEIVEALREFGPPTNEPASGQP